MLYNVESAQVDYGSLTRLKYSARITMTEDNDIDYLSDMIKIICAIDGEKKSYRTVSTKFSKKEKLLTSEQLEIVNAIQN